MILLVSPLDVNAQDIQNRSVQLSSAAPSAIDTHTYQFIVPTTSVIGSIVFEYCANSPVFTETCSAPSGLNVTSANLAGQSGNTGFSIDGPNSTANKLVITRPPSAGAAVSTTFVFGNIVNPATAGSTVFVKIATHSSTDGSGPYNDKGAVAFVTAVRFTIDAFVPPFLQLCVGLAVTPNCSSVSGDSLNLGVLSPNHANAGQSQFATGTNSPSGYAIYALGTTMTSGTHIIPALSIPTTNFPGTGQFGINLRANLSPSVGQDPVGLGIAAPTANYNVPNRFMFSNGDSIALASQPSDYNRMTVSYLVNIPAGQTPGIYTTTITYLAVAQF